MQPTKEQIKEYSLKIGDKIRCVHCDDVAVEIIKDLNLGDEISPDMFKHTAELKDNGKLPSGEPLKCQSCNKPVMLSTLKREFLTIGMIKQRSKLVMFLIGLYRKIFRIKDVKSTPIKGYDNVFKMNTKRKHNPLHKGKMRNYPCICGSEKKMKHCHGKDASVSDFMFEEIKGHIATYRKGMNKKAVKFEQAIKQKEKNDKRL